MSEGSNIIPTNSEAGVHLIGCYNLWFKGLEACLLLSGCSHSPKIPMEPQNLWSDFCPAWGQTQAFGSLTGTSLAWRGTLNFRVDAHQHCFLHTGAQVPGGQKWAFPGPFACGGGNGWLLSWESSDFILVSFSSGRSLAFLLNNFLGFFQGQGEGGHWGRGESPTLIKSEQRQGKNWPSFKYVNKHCLGNFQTSLAWVTEEQPKMIHLPGLFKGAKTLFLKAFYTWISAK